MYCSSEQVFGCKREASRPSEIAALGILDSVTPPSAPRNDHSEVRHGEIVSDPYFWLREKSNPEVVKYLEAENAYTAAQTSGLKPLEEKLYSEMLGRIKQTDLEVPERHGDYLYYSRSEEGKQYSIYCRRKGSMEGTEQVILDLNELAQGHEFVAVGDRVVSDDHNLLAYTVDYTGFRQYTLQVKDLRTGEILPDTIERVTSLAWGSDNKTLFLTTEDETTKRPNKLLRHVLGEASFELLVEETDELFDLSVHRTRDKTYVVLQSESKDTTEAQTLRADEASGAFRVLYPREAKHRYYVEHRKGLFYIRTNKGGINFEIVSVPETDPRMEKWEVLLHHRANVLIENIDLFETFLVSEEMTEASMHLRIYKFEDRNWTSIPFPEPVYSAFTGGTHDFESITLRYTYTSFVTPRSVFDYDTQTGQTILLKRKEVLGAYDPNEYVSERLWAPARDGVQVPISIVYKRGFEKNGSGPLFLYAYGSYGISMPVSFNSNVLSLLGRGVAYAIAHIRGGSEMGEQWREDGMLMKKKNTFNDFIDSAKYLIAEEWTSADRLLIEGGSAGGLLMGAVVNQSPELFRAVHLSVPFVDVMNTMMDPSLPLTVGEYIEWGDPNDKAAYDYMKTYSPYDNLETRAYPAILVTSSLNDSQVMYWEPAKYVARLRSVKTNGTPLLLKMKMNPAGHGGASGRYDRLHDTAFEYAWLLSQLGIME